jgi:hypothetical protein
MLAIPETGWPLDAAGRDPGLSEAGFTSLAWEFIVYGIQ